MKLNKQLFLIGVFSITILGFLSSCDGEKYEQDKINPIVNSYKTIYEDTISKDSVLTIHTNNYNYKYNLTKHVYKKNKDRWGNNKMICTNNYLRRLSLVEKSPTILNSSSMWIIIIFTGFFLIRYILK